MSNTTQYIDAYYIDPKYGNDNNSGTQNSPFKTIQKGVNAAGQNNNDGNKVYLKNGTYYLSESVKIDSYSGTSNAPLTIQSAPGEKAILDGRNVTIQDALVEVKDAWRINIANLEIRNAPSHGIEVINGHYINIDNNFVHNTQGMGIRVRGYVADSEYEGDTTVQSSFVEIESNGVFQTNLSNSGSKKGTNNWGAGIQAWNADEVKIINNTVGENYGEGIGLTIVDDGTVSNNYLYDNFSAQIYLDNATDSVVQKNITYNSGDRRFYNGDFSASGIVLGNEIHDIANPSLYYLNNNKIYRNIVVNANTGIMYGTWAGKHQNTASTNAQSLKNTSITNNTFYNSEFNTVRFYGDSYISNVNLSNNIFRQGSSGEISEIDNLTGIKFNNNIWDGGSRPGDGFSSTDIIAEPLFTNPGGYRVADYQLKPDYFVVSSENSNNGNLDYLFTDQTDFGALKIGEPVFTAGDIIK